jgi:hypothetical protein
MPKKQRNHGTFGFNGARKADDSHLLAGSSVNKKYLLARGWTRTAIKRILGEPDRRLTLKRRRKDRPECRYDLARVLAAESAGLIRFRKRRLSVAERAEINAVYYRAEAECPVCYAVFKPNTAGRPRKYCSTKCRNGASRNRVLIRAKFRQMRDNLNANRAKQSL